MRNLERPDLARRAPLIEEIEESASQHCVLLKLWPKGLPDARHEGMQYARQKTRRESNRFTTCISQMHAFEKCMAKTSQTSQASQSQARRDFY